MKTLICCFAILSLILVCAPVQAENWMLYDHFKGGFFYHGGIDPNKWAGLVLANTLPPGFWVGENVMEVLFGRFHILNQAYGGVLPPPPPIFLEQDLFLRNYEGVKGIKATLNILAAEVSGCSTQLQTLPLPAVRARLWGHFFKAPDGLDVGTFLFVERSNDMTDAFNILNVKASIAKCADAKCMAYNPIYGPFPMGTVRLWENIVLSLQWDEPNNQFIYRLNNNPPFNISYDGINEGPPVYANRKAISAIDLFAPCGAEGQEAFIDVYFDNVYVLK